MIKCTSLQNEKHYVIVSKINLKWLSRDFTLAESDVRLETCDYIKLKFHYDDIAPAYHYTSLGSSYPDWLHNMAL